MQQYETPRAEFIDFNYDNNIVASLEENIGHGDMGIGFGNGGGCDHDPGHGNPHKPHPTKKPHKN